MLRLTVFLFLFAINAPGWAQTLTPEAGVRAAIAAYADGYRNRDRALLEQAFDIERAQISHYIRNEDGLSEARSRPISEWISAVTGEGPAREADINILSISIIGDQLATALIDFDGAYYDLMVLAEIGGEWRIVRKDFISQPD